VNPAVVQIRTKTSTVCHACADRTLDIIRAANEDAALIAGPGDPRYKTKRCRHCGLRRRLWWFIYEYGLDSHARVVPLEVQPEPAPDPCVFCGGSGYVEDENWSPEPYELREGRRPGAGLIECGMCDASVDGNGADS
jgi:hypothetical protein